MDVVKYVKALRPINKNKTELILENGMVIVVDLPVEAAKLRYLKREVGNEQHRNTQGK